MFCDHDWPIAPKGKTPCPFASVTVDGLAYAITNNTVWFTGPEGGKKKPLKWKVAETLEQFDKPLIGTSLRLVV